jgi:hypothetical protein
MKVGELYAELGLEDILTRESKKSQAGFEKIVAKMDSEVTLDLDINQLAKAADEARADVAKLRKELAEKVKAGDLDTSQITLALAEAEERSKRARKALSEKVTAKLDADDSGVQAAARAAKDRLDGVASGDYTAKVRGDVSDVDAGAAEGESSLLGMIGGWTAAAGVAAAAVGTVIAMKLIDAAGEVLARSKINDNLEAALLLSPDQAARAARLASQSYLDNWGDSFEDVSNAYRAVLSSTPEGVLTTDEAIKRMAERALNFASIYGEEVPESILAAGALVKNGLAKSTDEAWDLMHATLATTPEALWGDVFDVLTQGEYLPAFKALGLSGQEAFGIIADAADGGSFMLDKAGDALKEFVIKATDGSSGVRDAYKVIGLSNDQMANDLLAGGDTARAAFEKIVDGLLGIEDPAKRANTAIALFGTPIEDLGPAEITGFLQGLDSMGAGLGDVAGAAEQAGKAANDNFLSKWQDAIRNFDVGALADKFTREGLPGLKAQVSEGVDQLTALWEQYGPAIRELIGAGLEALDDLWDEYGPPILDALGDWWTNTAAPWIEEKAGEALQAAWDAVVARFKELITDPETFVSALENNPMSILGRAMGAKALELIGQIPGWLGGIWEKIETWFGETTTSIGGHLSGWLGAFAAWAYGVLVNLPGWLGSILSMLGGWITDTALPAIKNRVQGWVWAMLDWAGDAARNLPGRLADIAGAIFSFIGSLPGRIRSAAGGMWDGISDSFRSAINAVIGWWNQLRFPTFDIPSVDVPFLGKIGGGTIGGWDLPNIPTLASGAYMRARSPMLSIVGEGPTPEFTAPEPMLRKVIRDEMRRGGDSARVAIAEQNIYEATDPYGYERRTLSALRLAS